MFHKFCTDVGYGIGLQSTLFTFPAGPCRSWTLTPAALCPLMSSHQGSVSRAMCWLTLRLSSWWVRPTQGPSAGGIHQMHVAFVSSLVISLPTQSIHTTDQVYLVKC
jgi:hypothetical protein